jgi:hypothetical protein|mmetsp:Transcript_57059/g.90726  ORF Transcript_57059/g.90726 Transcript_57059/m.90726 type:complete len:87 (+) Transcript_57059:407-667(+)
MECSECEVAPWAKSQIFAQEAAPEGCNCQQNAFLKHLFVARTLLLLVHWIASSAEVVPMLGFPWGGQMWLATELLEEKRPLHWRQN